MHTCTHTNQPQHQNHWQTKQKTTKKKKNAVIVVDIHLWPVFCDCMSPCFAGWLSRQDYWNSEGMSDRGDKYSAHGPLHHTPKDRPATCPGAAAYSFMGTSRAHSTLHRMRAARLYLSWCSYVTTCGFRLTLRVRAPRAVAPFTATVTWCCHRSS